MRGRLIVLLGALLLLAAGCRLDVDVDVTMASDGSGSITVTAVADQELVAQAPGLADDLHLDDFRNVGWVVQGPTPTDGGGLQVVVTHDFDSPDEANALLASLNGADGPFQGLSLTRTVDGSKVTFGADGALQLVGGVDAFSDDYVASLGAGTPFAAALAASGQPLTDELGITLSITLPKEPDTNGDLTDGVASWQAPVDGSSATVQATATSNPSNTGKRLLALLALAVLVGWIAVSAAFIVYVVRHRRPTLTR